MKKYIFSLLLAGYASASMANNVLEKSPQVIANTTSVDPINKYLPENSFFRQEYNRLKNANFLVRLFNRQTIQRYEATSNNYTEKIEDLKKVKDEYERLTLLRELISSTTQNLWPHFSKDQQTQQEESLLEAAKKHLFRHNSYISFS